MYFEENQLLCDIVARVQDLRRNQKRIAELNATIRKLEDRNTLLVDERNELVCELLHWQTEEVESHGERQRGGGSKDKAGDEYALSIHQAHHSGG